MSRYLEELSRFNATLAHPVLRVSEIHDGGEVETVNFADTFFCLDTYSCAKSYTAAAIGLLYDRGLVGLEEKVCDILADQLPASGMDERWHLMTVDMALRHSVGLPGGFLDIDQNPISVFGEDFLTYMLTYPLSYTPGEQNVYTDGAFYLLARIAEKRAGMPVDDFLWRELFTPLGFQEAAWSRCPHGYVMGGTGLYLNSSDMVKLGELYRTGGLWRGRRILSEKWTELTKERGYGWSYNRGCNLLNKGGMYGQTIGVFFDQNRVIAVQGFRSDTEEIVKWTLGYED